MPDSNPHGWQPPTALEIATLFPRYHVVELSAVGGLSSVYRIRQEDLDRDLALKFLRRGGPESGEWASRFRKEALLMSRIKHATIPTVYDFGRYGTDCFCIMEFIEGVSLHVGHYMKNWTMEQVSHFIAAAAEGLHLLHEDGVVHGDVKPDNVMVTDEGNVVKIIDFGTACTPGERKLITEYDGPRQLTAGFAAPELYQNEFPVDHRADIFGLGATLFQFLLGEAPPEHLDATLIQVEKQPRALRKFLKRCLATDPNDRFQDSLQFASELRKLGLRGPVFINGRLPASATTASKQLFGFLRKKWTAMVGS
jgi:eukaryotic-like serine/threonine-protein kinase